MKKSIALVSALLVLVVVFGGISALACEGRSRNVEVACWKTFGTYQYAKATQSAACDGRHSVTLKTELRLMYTTGAYSPWASGTSSKQLQVPDGKVGASAHGRFNAKCTGNYTFPERTATDKW